MADPKDPESSIPSDDSSIGIDTDWGEDWESAFQAEDQMFSTETGADTGDNFFLEETLTSIGTADGTVTKDKAADDKTTGVATLDKAQAETYRISFDTPPSLSQLLALTKTLAFQYYSFGKNWFGELQFYQKIITTAGAFAFIIIIAIGLNSLFSTKPPQKIIVIEPSAQVNGYPPEVRQDGAETTAVASVEPEKPAPEALIFEDGKRARWSLSSFIIPSTVDNAAKDKAFVIVDLTCITYLPEETEIPEDKRTLLREMIYQFYVNRPYYELRRYTLARGEMGRKLMDWLKKQWPDAPIAAIQFDRYQIT